MNDVEITVESTIVEETMIEEIIGKWIKPKDFNLTCNSIRVPVFKFNLNIAYGEFEEFKRFLILKFGHDVKYEAAHAMVCSFKKDGIQWHWMNIQQMQFTAEDYGTMVHELHHFAHFAMEEMGVTYGMGGEEVYAYLQGHMMEMVCRAFSMLRKKLESPVVV